MIFDLLIHIVNISNIFFSNLFIYIFQFFTNNFLYFCKGKVIFSYINYAILYKSEKNKLYQYKYFARDILIVFLINTKK